MSETPELPPLDREDDVEGSLGWHALNYRTAHTSHAQGMYEELERWVSAYGRECWDAGRRAGLEEAAKLTPVAPWPDFAGQPIRHGDSPAPPRRGRVRGCATERLR